MIEALLRDLVRIPSVNPSLVPDGVGELAIARYIEGWLADRGFAARLQETSMSGRPNVIGIAKGRGGGGRSILLVAHIDTVGTAGMRAPYSARISGGRMYGRGSIDMKSGLAVAMLAGAEAAREGLRGDVIVAGVVDEEHSSIGCEALVTEIKADGAVLTESTAGQVVLAHKGFGWYEIETAGRAAHGSRPDLGKDAIAHMGTVLTGIDHLAHELATTIPHPLIGYPSIHASLIRGGQELSSYPASCVLQLERRTVPGETREVVAAQLDAILANSRRENPDIGAELRTLLWRDCLEQPDDMDILESLLKAGDKVLGSRLPVVAASGWTDAAILAAAGTPTVVYGPTGEGAHGEVEWVDLDSVHKCYDCVLETVREFCS